MLTSLSVLINFRLISAILFISTLTGLSSALFLWLLDFATITRLNHPWLMYLLPVAGFFIWWLFKKAGSYGRYAERADAREYQLARGNDLVIDEVHAPADLVPFRLAPLILITTIITHLFGGSAGREGTALQMGGGIAAGIMRFFKSLSPHRKVLLLCGLAAGFGSVFGTPLAGGLFAAEVITRRKIEWQSLLPCLLAAFAGDFACHITGVHHTLYEVKFKPFFAGAISEMNADRFFTDGSVLLNVILGGALAGLAARLFITILERIKSTLNKMNIPGSLSPVLGGLLVLLMTCLLGTTDYLGLGVSNPDPNAITILSSFHKGGATDLSWFWKLLLTAITLGFGFRGGEVTPLFFIGATLGNVVAFYSGAPVDLLAAVCFIAVFAGATKTPVACTVMGIELFGTGNIVFFATGCVMAYLLSGHQSIYKSQRQEI
ncbi:MAG: chloride channel protein [Flavitalea sp.]